jgi:hypothetical protein
MKRIWLIVVLLAFIFFAVFVWPTRYAYHRSRGDILVRMDRITGVTWHYQHGKGWVKDVPPAEAPKVGRFVFED